MQDIEQGYSRRLAVVIPPGPGWPLRAYELAVFITLQARGMSMDLRTTIVAPEPSPLAALGARAVELIGAGARPCRRGGLARRRCGGRAGSCRDRRASVRRDSASRSIASSRFPGCAGARSPGYPRQAQASSRSTSTARARTRRRVVGVAGDGTAFAVKIGRLRWPSRPIVSAEDIAALVWRRRRPAPLRFERSRPVSPASRTAPS